MTLFNIIYKMSVIYGHIKATYRHTKELLDLLGFNVTDLEL